MALRSPKQKQQLHLAALCREGTPTSHLIELMSGLTLPWKGRGVPDLPHPGLGAAEGPRPHISCPLVLLLLLLTGTAATQRPVHSASRMDVRSCSSLGSSPVAPGI